MSAFNHLIVASIPLVPRFLIRRFANPYIAGETLDEAIEKVKKINASGAMATLDLLGEFITEKTQATRDLDELKRVLEAINTHQLDSNLSVKPTQMGLLLDEQFAYDNIRQLVELAKSYNNFVRIDMEDSECTQKEINLYQKLREEFDNVGLVIQAYLRRSEADVASLIKMGTNLRLCKGIYVEPESIAFKSRREVQESFVKLIEMMFKSGQYVGVATHDVYVVEKTYELVEKYKVGKEAFEFQMLLGVLPKLRDSILEKGYRLRIYVPYGQMWYNYSVRRFKENPELAGYVLKALLGFK